MSSAISTDGPLQNDRSAAADRAAFRPWHFFTVGALVAATAAVWMSRRTVPEHLVMLSVTVFAAGAAAYACYRMLAPLVGQEPGARAGLLGDMARRAIEREKTILLRTIKELEFDRAMGKIAEDDFADMSARLRQRALRLMRQLEDVQAAARAKVERELSARVGSARASDKAAARPHCRTCHTLNDVDARFCKSCGSALADG